MKIIIEYWVANIESLRSTALNQVTRLIPELAPCYSNYSSTPTLLQHILSSTDLTSINPLYFADLQGFKPLTRPALWEVWREAGASLECVCLKTEIHSEKKHNK
ncbi:hypothetical protein TNCV_1870241 [Trichonephila clavipes]|nr:hypothetical protein TNCV_1870241 [Trichonephila clavipes]